MKSSFLNLWRAQGGSQWNVIVVFFSFFLRWPRIVFIFQYKFFMASTIPLFYQLARWRHFSSSGRRCSQVESRPANIVGLKKKKKKHTKLFTLAGSRLWGGLHNESLIHFIICMSYVVSLLSFCVALCCVMIPEKRFWNAVPKLTMWWGEINLRLASVLTRSAVHKRFVSISPTSEGQCTWNSPPVYFFFFFEHYNYQYACSAAKQSEQVSVKSSPPAS